jgi:hypothetical protein
VTGIHATISFPNAYGEGWHAVSFSLTNNDHDYPGAEATSVFTIMFLNNAPPAVVPPANVSGEVGSLNATLSWTIADAYTNGTAYTIYCNGTVVAASSWASGVPVTYATGFLMPGAWNFTLAASDGYGGTGQGTCWVTVTDTPPAVLAPANASYAEGVLHWVVNWTITDPSVSPLAAYLLLLNGAVVGQGTWVSGTAIAQDVGGLAPGRYNATLVASDGYGAATQGTSWVAVADVPPAITASPANVTYEVGTPGASITWTVAAAFARNPTYALFRNGTQVGAGAWASGVSFTTSVGGLAVGWYNFTLRAADGYGGTNQDSCWVTVVAPPVVTLPATASYEIGTSLSLPWSVAGATSTGNKLAAFVDGTRLASAPTTWSPGVPGMVVLSGLLPGLHNATLVATDACGGVGQGTCWVAVLDTPPAISAPANVTYAFGTPSANITWAVTANHPASRPTYVLCRNGTQVGNGTWASGVPFNTSLSGLAVGAYNFTLAASDGWGATAAGNVLVFVTQANVAAMVQNEFSYLNATNLSCWKDKDACLKADILNDLQRVEGKLAAGNYAGAYNLLNKTVAPDLQAWVVNATLKVQCSQWAAATLNAIYVQIPASLVAIQLEAAIAHLSAAILLAANASLGCQGLEVVRLLKAAQVDLNRSLAAYLAASVHDAKYFARAAKDCVCSADSIADAFHGHTMVGKTWETLDVALDCDAASLSAILGIFAVE